MGVQVCCFNTASGSKLRVQVINKMKNLICTLLGSAVLAGCSTSLQPTQVTSYETPVDSQTGIRNTHYHGIIGVYNHREPVDPRSWRKLNEEQTPKEGAGHGN